MSGWVIVVAVLALLVVTMRLWFRWFSHRPLTSTDDYAVAVDTAVDSADPRAHPLPPPPPGRDAAPAVAVGTGSTATGGEDRTTMTAAVPAASLWRQPAGGQPFIPQQRVATGDRASAPERIVAPPMPPGTRHSG